MPERKNNHEMHSWVAERLSAYMDNRLSSLERVRLERHLRDCSQCQRVLSSLQWTVSLLKQAPAPALPRSFMVPVPKQTPRAPIISISLLRLATAMATLLLISLVGIDVIMQLGSAGTPAMLSAPRIAVGPTIAASQPQAPSTELTSDANVQLFREDTREVTTAPLPKATMAPTEAPPVVAPLPGTLPTALPPTAVAKPAAPPAATSAPAATAAPAAGALQSQAGTAVRPSLRSSTGLGSPTPSAPPVLGKGGGPEKSSQDSPAATAAPLLSQPHTLPAEVITTTSPVTETLPPTPATTAAQAPPTATPSPRQEALAQPTRALVTQPTAVPSSENISRVSALRIAELGVLFVAVFLGVLTLILRR